MFNAISLAYDRRMLQIGFQFLWKEENFIHVFNTLVPQKNTCPCLNNMYQQE